MNLINKRKLLKPRDLRHIHVQFGQEALLIDWFGPGLGILGTAYKDRDPFFNLGERKMKDTIAYIEAVRKLTKEFVHGTTPRKA